MEESKEDWKGYLIYRSGKYWRVRNENYSYPGVFTMLSKARAYVDALIVNSTHKERKRVYSKEIKRIREISDLNKRTKEYKKLCQTLKSL